MRGGVGPERPGPSGAGTDTADPVDASRGRGRLGEFVFAGLSLALGLFAVVGASSIRVPDSANAVGPTAFPYLVGGILIVSSLGVLVEVLRGRLGAQEEGEDIDATVGTDWLTLAKIVIAIIAHIALIPIIGWAFAAAVLFAIAAWALGAARWWVAALVGLALGLAIQLGFGLGLGLSLPAGPLLGPILGI
ncbi:hypothetical protein GCM10009792_19890 [Microcella alkalica]